MLTPSAKIRFLPESIDTYWNVSEAINSTRLLFAAWDLSDKPEGFSAINRFNTTFLNCDQVCYIHLHSKLVISLLGKFM